MDGKAKLPESALFDHRLVKAPYLRYAGIIELKSGDKIYKYDLRFVQPNSELIPTAILHTLEHLLAVTMRQHIDGIVDISPMGCLTGFYIVAINQPYDKLIIALAKALRDVSEFKEIPFANEIQCGAAKNHDLVGAKKYAKEMLEGQANWEIGAKNAMNQSANVELH
jgi:S-ribosylhomocysteine lyase